MNLPSKILDDVVQAFAQLPGVGQKSALRMALHLLKMKVEFDAEALARTPAEGPVLFIANHHDFGIIRARRAKHLTHILGRHHPGLIDQDERLGIDEHFGRCTGRFGDLGDGPAPARPRLRAGARRAHQGRRREMGRRHRAIVQGRGGGGRPRRRSGWRRSARSPPRCRCT